MFKKLLVVSSSLFILALTLLGLPSCGSNNSPSTPSNPGPTATPSLPSQSVTFTTTAQPFGLRFQYGGYLWLADAGIGNKIQKITTSGAAVTTVTSFNGGSTFNLPGFLCVDGGLGLLYVSDTLNHQVEVFLLSTLAYMGNLGSAQLGSDFPSGVVTNSAGTTFYLADLTTPKVLVYSITPGLPPTHTYLTAFGNSGPGQLSNPYALVCDSQDNVWAADDVDKRVVEYNPSGVYQRAITLTSNGVPHDVAVDGSGNIFITDTTNNYVQEFNAAGQHLYNFAGSLSTPWALTLDDTKTYLYVSDENNSKVGVFKIH